MEDGDTEKYHVSSVIQDFVFLSWKKGCIRCISLLVYNKEGYPIPPFPFNMVDTGQYIYLLL